MGYDDFDHPSLMVGTDGQIPLSSSVSADSAEQTSGVDSPNFNQEATRLYSSVHTGIRLEQTWALCVGSSLIL